MNHTKAIIIYPNVLIYQHEIKHLVQFSINKRV